MFARRNFEFYEIIRGSIYLNRNKLDIDIRANGLELIGKDKSGSRLKALDQTFYQIIEKLDKWQGLTQNVLVNRGGLKPSGYSAC